MKKYYALGFLASLLGASYVLRAADVPAVLVVTASNDSSNQLMVYSSANKLMQVIPTQGQGGVSGNAGGIASRGKLLAVVNFGSKNVSIFERKGDGFEMMQMVPAVTPPVSVAFSPDHLYILGATRVESHRIFGTTVNTNPDGSVALLKADGSAAQLGVVGNQLIIAEKANVMETVNLLEDGSVSGAATLVQGIPANVDTPFGMATRGNNAYVTIAHADEISLVRNGKVLTTTPSMTEHSPCWLALMGPFLYSSNSPSKSISRYAVYGQKMVQDAAVVAQLKGSPTDIASGYGLLAVVDNAGGISRLSIFAADVDGNLTLQGVNTIASPANGVAVVRNDD
jgi:hypothetical protein